jgi:hypothetical protein
MVGVQRRDTRVPARQLQYTVPGVARRRSEHDHRYSPFRRNRYTQVTFPLINPVLLVQFIVTG